MTRSAPRRSTASNRKASTASSGNRIAYPGAALTGTSAGARRARPDSSARRRFETDAGNEAVARGGGSVRHNRSIIRSTDTMSPRPVSSSASTRTLPRPAQVGPFSVAFGLDRTEYTKTKHDPDKSRQRRLGPRQRSHTWWRRGSRSIAHQMRPGR